MYRWKIWRYIILYYICRAGGELQPQTELGADCPRVRVPLDVDTIILYDNMRSRPVYSFEWKYPKRYNAV